MFLTIYLFIKSYQSEKFRFLYLIFAAISLVFIVLSRPLEAIYLILLLPLAIRMVSNDWKNKKRLLVNYLPALGIVIVGAVIVCVMNYVRFGSILEFGEHYQLTVNDCTKNHLSVQGILPTLFHYFIQPPHYDSANQLLTYSDISISIESHSYIASSVGLVFIPVALFVVLMPFVFKKGDDISFRIFTIASPVVIFLVAFINYCFAGVCPRYLNDFVPWAALLGGLIALKAIEKDNDKHPVVPSLISVALMISVILTAQYHFIGWDGLRIGDFGGLLGMIKTVTNQYYI